MESRVIGRIDVWTDSRPALPMVVDSRSSCSSPVGQLGRRATGSDLKLIVNWMLDCPRKLYSEMPCHGEQLC